MTPILDLTLECGCEFQAYPDHYGGYTCIRHYPSIRKMRKAKRPRKDKR